MGAMEMTIRVPVVVMVRVCHHHIVHLFTRDGMTAREEILSNLTHLCEALREVLREALSEALREASLAWQWIERFP